LPTVSAPKETSPNARRVSPFLTQACETVHEQRRRRIVFSLCLPSTGRQSGSLLLNVIGQHFHEQVDVGVFTQDGPMADSAKRKRPHRRHLLVDGRGWRRAVLDSRHAAWAATLAAALAATLTADRGSRACLGGGFLGAIARPLAARASLVALGSIVVLSVLRCLHGPRLFLRPSCCYRFGYLGWPRFYSDVGCFELLTFFGLRLPVGWHSSSTFGVSL